jgi:hypothetical protein
LPFGVTDGATSERLAYGVIPCGVSSGDESLVRELYRRRHLVEDFLWHSSRVGFPLEVIILEGKCTDGTTSKRLSYGVTDGATLERLSYGVIPLWSFIGRRESCEGIEFAEHCDLVRRRTHPCRGTMPGVPSRRPLHS